LNDFVSPCEVDVAVTVEVAVAVAVAFEAKLTSFGVSVNSFPSVQHSFVSPQQNGLPDPPGRRVTSVDLLAIPPFWSLVSQYYPKASRFSWLVKER